MFNNRIFNALSSKNLSGNIKNKLTAFCDDDAQSSQSIIQQVEAEIEKKGKLIKTPPQYENLKGIFQQANVSSYDGCRLVVQKQVNLNTVVSHFAWIGSQKAPPIYQYRLILPFDDKVINVASDADFNIEGEIKYPIAKGVSAKSNFTIHEQGKNLSCDIDFSDESSTMQLSMDRSGGNTFGLSYMQAITPYLTLGGLYKVTKGAPSTSFGGIFDYDNNNIVAQYEANGFHLLYLKRVNPNRVSISAELVVDDKKSQATVGAEYTLKQSKVHMSIDSDLTVKSTLDATITPNLTLQLCGEIQQTKDVAAFGIGLVFN